MDWLPAVVMLVLLALNVPVAFAIAIAGLSFFLMVQGTQPEAFIQRLVSITYSFPLLAIPFFVFTGVAINHGGMGRRIMNLADALAGHMVGGLAQVNVLLATFMAGTSGSSTAEAAMLSRVVVPEMTRKGYRHVEGQKDQHHDGRQPFHRLSRFRCPARRGVAGRGRGPCARRSRRSTPRRSRRHSCRGAPSPATHACRTRR